MRIGILNFAGHLNHGANLTAYALQRILTLWGHTPENLHLHCNPACHKWDVYTKFADENISISDRSAAGVGDMQKFNADYEAFIVGSDQVWREANTEGPGWKWKTPQYACYHLAFAAPGKRRIAVAASFGNDEYTPPDHIRQSLAAELKRFSAVSVREKSGVEIVKFLSGVDAEQLVDPVFYLEPEEWGKFCKTDSKKGKKRKTIAYNSFYHEDLLSQLLETFGNEYDMIDLCLCDTYQWLSTIRGADFVISDSFHVACFSLILGTPFACLLPEGKGEARFVSLQQQMGYDECRNIYPSQADDIISLIRSIMQVPLDVEFIYANMQHHRKVAHDWLQSALKSPIPQWSGAPYRRATRTEQKQEIMNNPAARKCHVVHRNLRVVKLLLAVSPFGRSFLKRKKAFYVEILDRMAW